VTNANRVSLLNTFGAQLAENTGKRSIDAAGVLTQDMQYKSVPERAVRIYAFLSEIISITMGERTNVHDPLRAPSITPSPYEWIGMSDS
jgi:hypothetical protein